LPKYSALIRFLIAANFIGLFGIFGISFASALDFDRLQQILVSKFGVGQANVLGEWRQMLASDKNGSDSEKLRRTNDFFNRRIAFSDDISIWGQSDYWATPVETIGRGRGDCEDFAIAKYFSLLNLGVPMNKLRLVYVKALQNGPGGQIQQAHMVLAYYASPNGDPLVLDNLVADIRPASKRTDLSPVFSFNSAGLWQGTGNQSSKSNLSRWQDLLARARAEGFQ
jgi:predicted transglutaminase-like cysteine proteinase